MPDTRRSLRYCLAEVRAGPTTEGHRMELMTLSALPVGSADAAWGSGCGRRPGAVPAR
jgi:hypothetical protein